MATTKQLNYTIQSVKKRIARLTKELSEAKLKVNKLSSDHKKAAEAEKKAAAAKKSKASKSKPSKSKAKKPSKSKRR